MPNCKLVSRLLSDALDRTLTPEEQQQVDLHLVTCPACKNCRQHFLTLKKWREVICNADTAS